MANLLETIVASAHRKLRKPLIMLMIHRKADHSFGIEYAFHGPTRGEVEACAVDLLRALRDDISGCPDCADCRAREARALAAIALLQDRGVPEMTRAGLH